jgi:transposase-like protein
MERLDRGRQAVSDFKGRHFGGEIVLWAVRWYCCYGISYRDLEQMMAERGVSVDHSTIYRWVQSMRPRWLCRKISGNHRIWGLGSVQQILLGSVRNFATEP